MANIATLSAKLTTDNTRWNKGLVAAQGSADKFVKGLTSSFIGIGTAFAGAFAFDALKSKLFDTLSAVDEISKTSRKLGIGSDALTGFREGADLAGVATEELDIALKRLTANVGDVRAGKLSEGFQRLGLAAGDLKGLKLDAILGKVADRMNAIRDPIDRAAVALQLFGKSGDKMVEFLAQGSAGLEKLKAGGQKFADDQLLAVEKLNDQFTALGHNIERIWKKAAVDIAEGAERIQDELADLQDKGFGAFVITGEGLHPTTNRKLREGTVANLKSVLDKLPVSDLEGNVDLFSGNLDSHVQEFKAFEDHAKRAAAVLREIATPQELYTERVAELGELLSLGALSFDQFEAAIAHAVDKLPDIERAARRSDPGGPEAAGFGSAAAARAIAAFERFAQQSKPNGQAEANRTLKDISKNTAADVELLRKILSAQVPVDIDEAGQLGVLFGRQLPGV
jgi:hypothetical protein